MVLLKTILAGSIFGACINAAALSTDERFYLKITGKTNKTILGYGFACHTGAALDGICFADGPAGHTDDMLYSLNKTNKDSGGILAMEIQNLGSVSLKFQYGLASNVAQPQFELGVSLDSWFSFDDQNNLYMNGFVNDSKFTPSKKPDDGPRQTERFYNWYLCWELFNAYYYQALGWAQSLPPSNPTCQAVQVSKEIPRENSKKGKHD